MHVQNDCGSGQGHSMIQKVYRVEGNISNLRLAAETLDSTVGKEKFAVFTGIFFIGLIYK